MEPEELEFLRLLEELRAARDRLQSLEEEARSLMQQLAEEIRKARDHQAAMTLTLERVDARLVEAGNFLEQIKQESGRRLESAVRSCKDRAEHALRDAAAGIRQVTSEGRDAINMLKARLSEELGDFHRRVEDLEGTIRLACEARVSEVGTVLQTTMEQAVREWQGALDLRFNRLNSEVHGHLDYSLARIQGYEAGLSQIRDALESLRIHIERVRGTEQRLLDLDRRLKRMWWGIGFAAGLALSATFGVIFLFQ